jgi:hypothetical protein
MTMQPTAPRDTTLLVVAEAYDHSADALLRAYAKSYDHTLVVAPASPPPDARWLVDDDEAVRHADARSDSIAALLRSSGLDANTELGDPDPLLAAEDAIALHPVDAVLIVAGDERSGERLQLRSTRLARPAAVIALHPMSKTQVPPRPVAATSEAKAPETGVSR